MRNPPFGSKTDRTGLALIVSLVLTVIAATAHAESDLTAGRRIYEQGVLSNGQKMVGRRQNGTVPAGAPSACATCHRPSGMGSVEADVLAPPVTGKALFGNGDKVIATMDPRTGKAFNQAHPAYTEAQVAALLKTGRYPDGRTLNPVMPRYDLSAADQAALIAHLKTLSAEWSPGVSEKEIRLATVVTPDVTPEQRKLFIEMAKTIVSQKNGSTKVVGPATRHHMTSAAELVLGTERNWVLDVWELTGPPETWKAQLEANYAKNPVFALVSGLGTGTWVPVSDFCDRNAVPCWFPSAPATKTDSPYTLGFSAGLSLEGRVLARAFSAQGAAAPHRVIQIYSRDEVGSAAAKALRADLRDRPAITVVDRVVDVTDADALEAAIAKTDKDDAVVFWLKPQSLAALAAKAPPAGQLWFSGVLGAGAAASLPASWVSSAHVVYPYDLPEARAANLSYFKAWLVQRRFPLVDEIWQSEVYFSFSFLTDTVSEMLDNLYRDYLIERAEMMIDRREASRAESEFMSSGTSHVRLHPDPTQESKALARGPEALRAQRSAAGTGFLQRTGTTVYPHLLLGAGQRFASKGAYVAHFSADGRLVADGEWVVP